MGPASYDLSTFLLRFPPGRRKAILDLYASRSTARERGGYVIVSPAFEAPAVVAGLDDVAVVGQAIEQHKLSFWDRRTSQNTPILDRIASHVTITDLRHLLFGHQVAGLGERSGRGPTYLVVELSDGRKRLVIAATDLFQSANFSRPTGLVCPVCASAR